MKEENKVLRNTVEQTLKDYNDLQMKLASIQQNNQDMIKVFSHAIYRFLSIVLWDIIDYM